MPHWKLTLSYDGSGFHGWQVQPGLRTVQGTLAEAIRSLCGEEVLPQGSGRTDTGVHALAQVASFSLRTAIPPPNLWRALNSLLPPSIRVLQAEHVPETFHARHSAARKTYEYRIFQCRTPDKQELRICPPFVYPYVWDCRWALDLGEMEKAASHLIGEHDFASFAATDPDWAAVEGQSRSTVRTVFSAAFEQDAEFLRFRITGNGFLHNMVRNIVGTLVDVGRGHRGADDLLAILRARCRSAGGPTAPARGLFLLSVEYPEMSS